MLLGQLLRSTRADLLRDPTFHGHAGVCWKEKGALDCMMWVLHLTSLRLDFLIKENGVNNPCQ